MAEKKRVIIVVANMTFTRSGHTFKVIPATPEDIWSKVADLDKHRAIHGQSQKVGDKVASMTEKAGYNDLERMKAMDEENNRINSTRNWNKPAKGKSTPFERYTELKRLVTAKGIPFTKEADSTCQVLSGYTPEEKVEAKN